MSSAGWSARSSQRFEAKGLRIAALKLIQVDRALAEKHYAEHQGKPFFEGLIEFITGGPVIVGVLEGNEAIAVVRTMLGATNGVAAAPGTVRGDFSISKQNNLVHGSDSPESAQREIALWFRPEEVVDYDDRRRASGSSTAPERRPPSRPASTEIGTDAWPAARGRTASSPNPFYVALLVVSTAVRRDGPGLPGQPLRPVPEPAGPPRGESSRALGRLARSARARRCWGSSSSSCS